MELRNLENGTFSNLHLNSGTIGNNIIILLNTHNMKQCMTVSSIDPLHWPPLLRSNNGIMHTRTRRTQLSANGYVGL